MNVGMLHTIIKTMTQWLNVIRTKGVSTFFNTVFWARARVCVLQFETVADGDDTGRPSVCHTVNRRYSEFLNLQARLEERPDVKKLIKSKKWSPLD